MTPVRGGAGAPSFEPAPPHPFIDARHLIEYLAILDDPLAADRRFVPCTDISVARPELDLAPPDWSQYLEHLGDFGVPDGLLSGADPAAFHVVLARWEGALVATGLAFDLGDDCGIYNVGTLERARRRGIGTAVSALLAHDAADRGCRTATLQSTKVAERVYAAVGFRDLGRILEYGPRE
jgi:GNAT superfamily N-acetyltransferase